MSALRATRSTRRAHPRLVRAGLAVAAALAATALTACGTAGGSPGSVVVTTNILGDVVQNIAGDELDVTVLMGPNADPHSFGISAKQAAQLQEADLVVYNGLGLEEGVLRTVEAAASEGVPTLGVGDVVDPLDFAPAADGDNASAGQADPHFWTDPGRMRTAVESITARLIEEVPAVDAPAIRANADAYLAELDDLEDRIDAAVATIPVENRALVTNHHVFGYFADRYGFEVIGAIVPSGTTLASPSASDLDSLATAIRSSGVPAIFVDSSQPDTLGQVLADESGLDVAVLSLYSESLTTEKGGAPSYIDMMDANVDTLARGLSP